MVHPVWDSLCLLDLIDNFLFHVGEIFNYNLFKNFLVPFLFLFFFWDLYNSNVGAFDIVPGVSETILSLFMLFTLFCSSEVISAILSSSSLIHSSASDILLVIPSRVLLQRRQWHPTPVLLPGEPQGQGSLVATVYGVTQSWT